LTTILPAEGKGLRSEIIVTENIMPIQRTTIQPGPAVTTCCPFLD
jgi:hypothetical protein